MRIPTLQQQFVLDSSARVRVVRACPGSGKTWLVAELIRRELEQWSSGSSGIAALSFTRVGGNEIRKAVGRELSHPHFVGTIDAFMFRYVIRPFLHKCFPRLADPRLIPAEWGADNWSAYGRHRKAAVSQGINVFGCVFISEANGEPVVAYKPHRGRSLVQLNGHGACCVKQAKLQMWEETGFLSHSDAAMWASRVLGHETLGTIIRKELVQRFPLIIVDELQDTGYFLGKCIRMLLEEPKSRGVLVGDPDQAIFEFNGARPDLFDGFESIQGAVRLTLPRSRRCVSTIAAAASHLKDSGGSILPASDQAGIPYLLRYHDMVVDLHKLMARVSERRNGGVIKVIARQTSTVVELVGRKAGANPPKLGSQSLNHILRAIVLFRQGRQMAALAATRAALNLMVFGYEGADDQALRNNEVDPTRWKRLAMDCLLRALLVDSNQDLYRWETEVGIVFVEKIDRFGLSSDLRSGVATPKPERRKGHETSCEDIIPQSATLTCLPIGTVHSVKGETHDLTIFVCPDTTANHCPSNVWWSADSTNREERRIAYVAMTRTRGDLIVCVSEGCYRRLYENHRSFVDAFTSMTVQEYINPTERKDVHFQERLF